MNMTTGNTDADMYVESALDTVFSDRAMTDSAQDLAVCHAAYVAGRVAIDMADDVAESITRGRSDLPATDDVALAVWGAHVAGAAYVAGMAARA